MMPPASRRGGASHLLILLLALLLNALATTDAATTSSSDAHHPGMREAHQTRRYSPVHYGNFTTMPPVTTAASCTPYSTYLQKCVTLTDAGGSHGVSPITRIRPMFWGPNWANSAFANEMLYPLMTFYDDIIISNHFYVIQQYMRGTALSVTVDHNYIVDSSTTADENSVGTFICNHRTDIRAGDYIPVHFDHTAVSPQYCGWHTWGSCDGKTYFMFGMTYDGDYPGSGGGSCKGSAPQGAPYTARFSGMSSVAFHELIEAMTDSNPGEGWLEPSGNENGDLCAWNMGSVTCKTNGIAYFIQSTFDQSPGAAGCLFKQGQAPATTPKPTPQPVAPTPKPVVPVAAPTPKPVQPVAAPTPQPVAPTPQPPTPQPVPGPATGYCSGTSCPAGQCRSQYGYCGTGSDYCNSQSTWSPTCTACLGNACPAGQCRSQYDYCGTGTDYCNAQSTWSQACVCSGAPCPAGQCRSQYGYCGSTTEYCNAQSTWTSSCTSPTPQPTMPTPQPTVPTPQPTMPTPQPTAPTAQPTPQPVPGPATGYCSGVSCPAGQCRSQWGYCGTGTDYCNSQSTWSPTCTACLGNACPAGQCRSQYDYCGTGSAYCNAQSTWSPTCVCSGAPCPAGQCRSQYMYCGSTSDYCNAQSTWTPTCSSSGTHAAGATAESTPDASASPGVPAGAITGAVGAVGAVVALAGVVYARRRSMQRSSEQQTEESPRMASSRGLALVADASFTDGTLASNNPHFTAAHPGLV